MRSKAFKVMAAILAAAAVCGVLWIGYSSLEKNYVFWNGSLFPKHEQQICISGKTMRHTEDFLKFTALRHLDARGTGMTVEQYEWFRRELPNCTVLWDIPIQGNTYPQDTEELHVEKLTDSEMNALQYFPNIRLLDVGNWDAYPQIQAVQARYPDCTVRYRISIAGEWWDSDVVSMILTDADVGELMEKLRWFENLESILLTGTIPPQAELQQLQEKYPHVFFLWKLEALGMSLETDIRELDLSRVPLSSVEELENLLPYFPQLEKVTLGINMDQEKLVLLAKQHPHIQFLFELVFGDRVLYTGAEELDLSNLPLESTAAVEEILPCFHNLKKVIMCECGISSEDMDVLNRKYEDIRFVWSVELAGMKFRTDSTYFTPNKWGISCDDENIYDLRYCTDMVCVDIGHHIKVTNCEWVRYMPELKYLILAETGIADLTPLENHKNLIYLELFLSKVTDYSPLTTCKALEDLNLCYTQGDPEPIGEMTWLKRLWWAGCWVGRTYLADKLPDTYAEYLSLSSTGRGWREGQHYYDMRDFIGMDYMVG